MLKDHAFDGRDSRQSSSLKDSERPDSASASNSDNSSGDENTQVGQSKKRKRPTKISCELCKARKVKCDRAEPSCGWCTKNNRVCIYKERKKPGLRASYGIELEDKLNQIEATLYLLGRRFEDHVSQNGCTNGQPLSYPVQQRSQAIPISQNNADYNTGTPGSQTSWLPPPPTSSNLQVKSSRAPDSMSVQSLVGGPEYDLNTSERPAASFIQTFDSNDLPPNDLLYDIVDLYFKHVGTWSPILDRKATFDKFFGTKMVVDEDKILLYAIVAVTLRFCKDPRLTKESKHEYHQAAKQRVQLSALENPSIISMKALALLTVDVLGTSNGPQGWNLLALLARNIEQLGLNVEKSVYMAPSPAYSFMGRPQAFALPQPESWIEDEGRRRLFWLTYILDRYATIATRFDFILDENETDRSLPCRYDLFSKNEPVETRWFRPPESHELSMNKTENLGSFSYHCEVLRILSQIHQFLRTPVNIESVQDVNHWRDTYRELDSKLNSWLSNLPGEYGKISQLCHSDPGSRVSNWIMIHAAFVTAVIRLHSVAAYPTSRSHLFLPSYNAVQTCLAAVESLKAIAQDVVDTGVLDLLGPPFGFSLWVSGRLLLVHAATTESAIDPKIWFLMSTLETMGQYWDVARNWAGTLSRLVREGQQADEDSRQGRVVTSGKTFSEMRRCAYELALQMARKPHSILDPPATRSTSLNELEYLDLFEWFSYPRIPASMLSQHTIGATGHGGGFLSGPLAIPNQESDWLNFKQPYEFKPPYE